METPETPATAFPPLQALADAANLVTVGGLMVSLSAVFLAVEGRLNGALICMMWAVVVDAMDGQVARKLKRTALNGELGKRLDSLVDMCSFGFAPVAVGYAAGLRSAGCLLALGCLATAVLLRLAYFDVVGLAKVNGKSCFIGMPSPYTGLALPVAFAATLVLPSAVAIPMLTVVYLLVALILVSGIKFQKLGGAWYALLVAWQLGLTWILLTHPLPSL